MKTFLSVVIVLAIVAPVCADTTLFSEAFEGGAAGTKINTIGWTAPDNMVIDAATIDAGQSCSWPTTAGGAENWPLAVKGFSHTPGTGEICTFTATLYAPGTAAQDSEVRLRASSDPLNIAAGVSICYGSLQFSVPNVDNWFTITPQPVVATDVKMVLSGTQADCYYKAHADSTWTHAGLKTGLGWDVSVYDEVAFSGHGGNTGGIDSILLTSNITTPEPGSIILLATGVSGLLAYAWRKRR
jgi:hypothetical protein